MNHVVARAPRTDRSSCRGPGRCHALFAFFACVPAVWLLPVVLGLGVGCGRDALDRMRPDGAGPVATDGSLSDGVDAAADGGDARAATIQSISVDPPTATLVRGSTQALVVTAVYDDGTTGPVTAQATFATSDATVATVSAGVVTAVARGAATITATVGTLSVTARITVSAAALVSIAVLPAMPTTAVGTQVAFTADATLSDGTHQDLTTSAAWTSSATGVASVAAATGVATALSAGSATITATFGGVSGIATLTVTAGTLTTLQVTPVDPTVGLATTIPFIATGIYSDGTRAVVTSQATWSSASPAVVTIDGAGRALTRTSGTATITAAFGGHTGTSTVTVTPAALVSIAVTPASATLLVGGTAILRAVGTYADGSSVDLSASVVWSVSPPAVVSVSNAGTTAGTVTALNVGAATVTATSGTVVGSASVTVSPARLVSIVVNPAAASIPVGTTVALTAEGIFSDASIRDITSQVAWQSNPGAVATVSNAAGQNGVVTGVGAGTATITATLTNISGSASVTVIAATLRAIAVTPANATTTVLLRSGYTATGTYSDGRTVDLTTDATWSTGNAAIAAISNTAGAQGQLLARANGTTTVTATLGTITGTTNVTVIGRVVVSLSIAPIAATTRLGTNVRFVATEIFSDGTQQNVSAQATWTSSRPAVATINSAGNRGLATPVAVGTTTITATFMTLTASTTLTVTQAVIASISVTPIAAMVPAGTVLQFTATAIYSDGTTQNVTGGATWISSAPGVLAITTAGGARGRGTGVSAGTVMVTATFMGLSGSTPATVTTAVLVQISVSPAGVTLVVGARRQFTAQAIFSDGTSRDVTAMATWTSDRPAVAGVSDAGATRGLVTAVGSGTANIQAAFGGSSGTVAITVSQATLTSIQVTPFNQTMPVGTAVPYQATGLFSDGTSSDLTATATWQVTGAAGGAVIAAVSNAAATRGLVTALAAGTAQIAATSGGITGSTPLTVTGATLVSIAITPANPGAAVGATVAFTALGTFSDATTLDITTFVTWTSSATAIADVSNAAGSRGQATAFATGRTTIQAQRGTVTATTNLAVN